MKRRSSWSATLMLSAAAAVTGLFSGCQIGPSDTISDEFARISSQEVSNMGANSSTMIGSMGQAKEAAAQIAAAADTIYYDWKIYPYSWDAASGSYIRTATFSNLSDGYDRLRVDTVTFLDAGNNKLRYPTLATVKNIVHTRNVKRTKNGNELDIRVAMNSAISLSPDTTHMKNGTITGTYDGEQVGTGTIEAVTRQYTNGRWQFPRSGTISVDFPRRSYEVQFLGGGEARLTITNKATDKTRVITVQVEQK